MRYKIQMDHFAEWLLDEDNWEEADLLYKQHIRPVLEKLEADDYFGTEGFDKRFS